MKTITEPRERLLSNAAITFIALQFADLVSTLVLLHHGGYEANTLWARSMVRFGVVPTVIVAKLIAIAMLGMLDRVRPGIVRKANIVYAAIVLWNLLLICVGVAAGK